MNYILHMVMICYLNQYKNGRYELYSPYGYDMLFKENNNIKDEK